MQTSFYSFVILIIVGFLSFYISRGVSYYDEGYILYGGQMIAQGEIPYKDFHFAYTPGSIVLTAFAFKIFEESILSERIITLIFQLFTIWILWSLLLSITKRKSIALLGIAMYIPWGPGHINFAWPVMFAICFGLLTCLLFIKGIIHKDKRLFFIAGITVILTFLFKQNFGVVLLVNCFLAYFWVRELKNKSYIGHFILGAIFSSSLFLLYLFITKSFNAFIDDFWIYTVQRIILEKTLDTPFIYGQAFAEKIVKTLFYLFPFLISLFGLVLCLKKKRYYFFVCSFCLLFYVIGIRPTTDYTHLVPLLSLSGIPLGLSLFLIKNKQIKKLLIIISVIFISLGIYSSFYKDYYRWEVPLTQQVIFVDTPRVMIFTDNRRNLGMKQLGQYIQNNTQEKEQIYVHYYAPIIYFLANRSNATSYAIHPSNAHMQVYQKEVIASLQKKKTRIVITHINNQHEKTPIGVFIRKNYLRQTIIDDYVVWKKII